MLKAVIFDLDGVIIDAVEWHYRAFNKALNLFGYGIEEKEHQAIYNGLPTAAKLDMLTQRTGFPIALHKFVNEMKQIYTQQILDAQVQPNVTLSGALRFLRAQGFKIGL